MSYLMFPLRLHTKLTVIYYFSEGLTLIMNHILPNNCKYYVVDRRRGRFSRLPEPPPVVVQSVDSADEDNPEESKLFVQFEVNNKVMHVNIKTPMKVVDKEDYEAEYGDKSNVNYFIF